MKDFKYNSYMLFVYEIDGVNEYMLMGKNVNNEYVSFKKIGQDLDYDSVCATISMFGKYCTSLSYYDIYNALNEFINRFKNIHLDNDKNASILRQVVLANGILERMLSPEEKLRAQIAEKRIYERVLRNRRILKAREENEIYDYCVPTASEKRIMEAYLESKQI